jgi:hypothetical protein
VTLTAGASHITIEKTVNKTNILKVIKMNILLFGGGLSNFELVQGAMSVLAPSTAAPFFRFRLLLGMITL